MAKETRATVRYIDVDTTDADKSLKAIQQQAEITSQGIAKEMSRGYMMMNHALGVIGVVLPEMFNLMATSFLMFAHAYSDLAKAETLSGWMAFKAATTMMAATILFTRAMVIKQQQTDIEHRLLHLSSLLDLSMR
jgi:hypothetical protein